MDTVEIAERMYDFLGREYGPEAEPVAVFSIDIAEADSSVLGILCNVSVTNVPIVRRDIWAVVCFQSTNALSSMPINSPLHCIQLSTLVRLAQHLDVAVDDVMVVQRPLTLLDSEDVLWLSGNAEPPESGIGIGVRNECHRRSNRALS